MATGKFGETKAKPWKQTDLKGWWEFTLKIDGARMLRDSKGNPVSRAGKPLYNLGDVPSEITDAEIFDKDWESSMSLVRTSVNGKTVLMDKVYSLDPIDPRLVLPEVLNPTKGFIEKLLEEKVSQGYEGLILRQKDKWLKVKPKDTADVFITGFQAGTGKHEGRMGALLTNYGKVGTGFSDAARQWWQKCYDDNMLIGLLIEVEFMEWTKNGIMRHPRYLRIRDDKIEENLGGSYETMFGMSED